MENISDEIKDAVLKRVATAHPQYVDIDLTMPADEVIVYKYLLNKGILNKGNGGFGDKSRLYLTDRGKELFADGGFSSASKKEAWGKVWEAIKLIRG